MGQNQTLKNAMKNIGEKKKEIKEIIVELEKVRAENAGYVEKLSAMEAQMEKAAKEKEDVEAASQR